MLIKFASCRGLDDLYQYDHIISKYFKEKNMNNNFIELHKEFRNFLHLNAFIGVKDVLQMLCISKTTLYEGIKKGRYPRPYQIS